MNKLTLLAVVASLAVFPVLSQAAQTDGVSTTTSMYGAHTNPNWQDDFFVAGQLGQSQFRGGYSHNHSVFQNVRLGWRWMGIHRPGNWLRLLGPPQGRG